MLWWQQDARTQTSSDHNCVSACDCDGKHRQAPGFLQARSKHGTNLLFIREAPKMLAVRGGTGDSGTNSLNGKISKRFSRSPSGRGIRALTRDLTGCRQHELEHAESGRERAIPGWRKWTVQALIISDTDVRTAGRVSVIGQTMQTVFTRELSRRSKSASGKLPFEWSA